MKPPASSGLLDEAVRHLADGQTEPAAALARRVLEIDPGSSAAWGVVAMASEASGRFEEALSAYEAALALAPDDPGLVTGLARLALGMDMAAAAIGMARQALALRPGDTEATCLLARALAREGEIGAATRTLQVHLNEHPEDAAVWCALGVMVLETGDFDPARTFLEEALRIAPDLTAARFNLANLFVTLGQAERALQVLEPIAEAGLMPQERAVLKFTRACTRLQTGDLARGWRDYEARNDPAFPGAAEFEIAGSRWRPGQPLKGRNLLLVGEQGLGDEVLFGSLIPDLLERRDRPASIALAVEPRLTSLFQRSFPEVQVVPHATVTQGGRRMRRLAASPGGARATSWTPIADLLQDLRPSLSDFPNRTHFLRADPVRLDAWRSWLSGRGTGLKVGLLWKSGLMSGGRSLSFPAFEAWKPVLETPGVDFVNLQYGDTAAEVAYAGGRLGVSLHEPTGLDLKQDLEGVAALSCALDLVIAVSNASFNLAGACGARSWLLTAPDAWTRLGSPRYPWYPQVRVFPSEQAGDWAVVLSRVAQALAQEAAQEA